MLRRNQIIEIVTHEEGRLHIRRVKVNSVTRTPGCHCGNSSCVDAGERYHVRAGNLQGKYARNYLLPLEPITNVRDPKLRNCTNWAIPSDLEGKADP